MTQTLNGSSATRERSYRILWLTAVGAVLGGILTAWLAPKVIVWYFNPPAQFGFSCTEPIAWALRRLVLAQLGGTVAGAIAGLAVALLVLRRRGRPPVAA